MISKYSDNHKHIKFFVSLENYLQEIKNILDENKNFINDQKYTCDLFEWREYCWSDNCNCAVVKHEKNCPNNGSSIVCFESCFDYCTDCACEPGCESEKPNFKFGDFEVRWYKHIGRGVVVNKVLSNKELRGIFNKVADHIENNKP